MENWLKSVAKTYITMLEERMGAATPAQASLQPGANPASCDKPDMKPASMAQNKPAQPKEEQEEEKESD